MKRVEKTDLIVGIHSSIGDWKAAFGKDDYEHTDSYNVIAFDSPKQNQQPITLALVASKTAESYQNPTPTRKVIEAVIDSFDKSDGNDILTTLQQSFYAATQNLMDYPNDQLSCAAVVVNGRNLFIASCGGCRIFLIRAGQFRQINVTHTAAEMLIDASYETVECLDKQIYQSRPITYHALTFDESMLKIDTRLRLDKSDDNQTINNQGTLLQSGDQIILCTYRVFWDWVSRKDHELFEEVFLDGDAHPQSRVDKLVKFHREIKEPHSKTIIALQIP